MRFPTVVVVLALVTAACGSSDQIGGGATAGETIAPPDTTSATQPGEAPLDTVEGDGGDDNDSTINGATTTTAEIPQIVQGDTQTDLLGSNGTPLSIEDALLPESALGAPWESQWREFDRIGYGAGANQTDCAEYWEYESLLGADGGHAMWWADGGNANHYVLRVADVTSILTTLLAIGSIADARPVVNWTEGGSFTTEFFDLDDAIGLRFTDEDSGEVTWVAITTHGDLISMLQIPLWRRVDGTLIDLTLDDLAALGTQMLERLQEAGPAKAPPSTVPPSTAPATTQPPAPTTTVPPEGLATLLLSSDELPEGWTLIGLDDYLAGGSDEELLAECPAAASIDRIDLALEWEARYRSNAAVDLAAIIGEMGSDESALDTIAEFAEVADCDFTVIFADAAVSGGLIDLPGTDAAATLIIESPELSEARLELLVAAVDAIIVVFTAEALTQDDPGTTVVDFGTTTLAKISAELS